MDPVALTRALVDIDSTTGRETEAGKWLAHHLRDRGFSVVEQAVDNTRFNVLATVGSPSVVFSTHFDCVPPFFPSRVDGDRLYGRGACDAKGILAAQVAAADTLRGVGETRVFLYASLPLILPQLVSYTLYRWENNIRAAAVLGVVGAGGLGQMLSFHLGLFQMGETSSILIAMTALVLLVDAFSYVARRALTR